MVDKGRLRFLNAGYFPIRRRAALEAKPRRLEHTQLVEQLTRVQRAHGSSVCVRRQS
jgi:hypothetical protein